MNTKTRWLSRFCLLLLLIPISVLVGCGGGGGGGNNNNNVNSGSDSKSDYELAVENGFTGTEQEWLLDQLGVGPEICVYCHNGDVARNGETHQEDYDQLFQQDVVVVSNLAYNNVGGNDVVTFKMTKNGANFDCRDADTLDIRFSEYDSATRRFSSVDANGDGVIDLLSLKGTLTYDGAGGCTSTKAASAFGNLSLLNGLLVVYGEDEIVDTLAAAHINLGRFPFAAILKTGLDGVDYASAANVTGCENCHQTPYYKHGYIRGDISNGGGLDFYACKVCHVDNRDGGHQGWQLSVDQPQVWGPLFLAAQEAAAAGDTAHDSVEENMTADQKTQYAYKTRLMNDVHMSHSMEFPYPQPIRTCATCHAGKLKETLSDDNFVLETCLSCHPLTGGTDTADSTGNFAVDTRPMALKTIWVKEGVSFHIQGDGSPIAQPCNECHKAGVGSIALFSDIHTGYDPLIYYKDADGNYQHYRDGIIASIDSVTLSDNILDIKFSASASENGTAAGLSAANVKPTVQVSFYGYDSKDFILSNHTKNNNGTGLTLEFTLGSADNALYTTVTNAAPNWEVKLNLAAYKVDPADYDIVAAINAGEVKKAEVIVRPGLDHPTITTVDRNGKVVPAQVGLNAVSKTVDVTADGTDRFVANYFQGVDAPGAKPKVGNALVKVEKVVDPKTDSKSGCNSCHDQLAITFHSGDRGGNIVVCRSCHVVTSGGSHLEGQSRSIDSYVHAIHRFQPFDVQNVDFNDPVEKAKYEEHTEFLFPDFAAINCERCHTDERVVDSGSRGTFDIPDQSKSMPGLLSATDDTPGISDTPAVITGPAARACGGCHRAAFIKEGDTGGYATFNEHTKRFGYRVESDDQGMLYTIIRYIMGLFQ